MLPNKYLEDLKSAPVHEVDFVATFIEVRDDVFRVGIYIFLVDDANESCLLLDV